MEFKISDFTRSWIINLESYVPGKTIKGYVKLASNENNYGPSPRVLEAIEKNRELINLYPHLDNELRKKISDYCEIKPENIIAGNGSDELIDLVVKAFRGPVLGFNPSFSWYKICTKILGEKFLQVNLNSDFTFPLEEFLDKSKEANLIFISNPNNPTGMVIPEDDLKEILEQGKITVVDEAYYEFYGKTLLPLVQEYENLIVLRTFAKAFALAGLRVGYGIASPELIEILYKIQPPFNVNLMAQIAAMAALDDIPFMKNSVEKIRKDRRILFNALNKRFRAFESEANFILIDTSPMPAEEFFDRMLKKKFIVRTFGKFPGFEGEFSRVTVGTTEENKAFIEALESI